MKKKRTCLSRFLMTSVLLLTLCMPPCSASAETGEQIQVPRVSSNEDLSTGQETVWDCIYFGSYPSAEVVRSSWDSVDNYAVMDGDVIRDDDLYKRLCEAGWSDNRVSLDGKDYIRINRADAVTAAADREQHYRWDDPDAWHYFAEEPIRWRVLSVKDGKALLLSDRILDCFPFNLADEEVTWKTSSVRSWLNGYDSSQNLGKEDYTGKGFLDKAFTADEREAIVQTVCTTPDNLDYGTDSGPDTEDYVFLLSNEEVYADESLPGGTAVTWDKIAFGSYPQTEILEKGDTLSGIKVDPDLFHKLQKAEWDGDELDLNGKRYRRIDNRYFRFDPIVWKVLEVSEDSALLLSTQALDCMPYYNRLEDVNWDRSDVRSWLNGLGAEDNLSEKDYSGAGESFLSSAFSEEERLSILESDVQNSDNHYFGTSCGPDTEDQVFLLSEDEIFSSPAAADYGFQNSDAVADLAKRFHPTAYAMCRGAWQSDLDESAGNTFWILRSNGYTDSNVVYVGETGYIFNRGIPVTCQDAGLIPAIRIDLETASYSYRGTASSRDVLSD